MLVQAILGAVRKLQRTSWAFQLVRLPEIAVQKLGNHVDNVKDVIYGATAIISQTFGASKVAPAELRGCSSDATSFQGAHKLLEFAQAL